MGAVAAAVGTIATADQKGLSKFFYIYNLCIISCFALNTYHDCSCHSSSSNHNGDGDCDHNVIFRPLLLQIVLKCFFFKMAKILFFYFLPCALPLPPSFWPLPGSGRERRRRRGHLGWWRRSSLPPSLGRPRPSDRRLGEEKKHLRLFCKMRTAHLREREIRNLYMLL